jgi:CPA2 family monovalent cation:H+ antiporter-2
VIAAHWLAVVVFTAVVITGKLGSVAVSAFLAGNGTRLSVQAGMSLTQIGELSFIIAGLGISLGATRDFLYPVTVAVSAITTLTTPLLIRAAGPFAAFVDRTLPRPLQTFAALYGTWLERLREPRPKTASTVTRRLAKLLAVDATILTLVIIGVAMSMHRIADLAAERLALSRAFARAALVGATIALATPFLLGIGRITRKLGASLAEDALPRVEEGKVDLAAAPRRVLVVTLELAIVLVVGLPLIALTQPFLPRWVVALGLAAVLGLLGIVFWRSAVNLEGHVKAGAEMIVEALVAQAKTPEPRPGAGELAHIMNVLPGLGDPVPLRIDDASVAVGRTLAWLNLRGVTGASVLAIARGDGGVIVPSATEVLRAGDVLALAGTRDAVRAATEVLCAPRR